jgi:hypothetical protein
MMMAIPTLAFNRGSRPGLSRTGWQQLGYDVVSAGGWLRNLAPYLLRFEPELATKKGCCAEGEGSGLKGTSIRIAGLLSAVRTQQ